MHILPLQFLSSMKTDQSCDFEQTSCHMRKRLRYLYIKKVPRIIAKSWGVSFVYLFPLCLKKIRKVNFHFNKQYFFKVEVLVAFWEAPSEKIYQSWNIYSFFKTSCSKQIMFFLTCCSYHLNNSETIFTLEAIVVPCSLAINRSHILNNGMFQNTANTA